MYNALAIADTEKDVDYEVLIAACLLHDIGRGEQFANPKLDHAEVGAQKAYRFLRDNHFSEEMAGKIRDCIRSHRFRNDCLPESIEAKILFDADKIGKLEHIYNHFYTEKGSLIARERQAAAVSFYQNIFREVSETCRDGAKKLEKRVEE